MCAIASGGLRSLETVGIVQALVVLRDTLLGVVVVFGGFKVISTGQRLVARGMCYLGITTVGKIGDEDSITRHGLEL
jgi:hypothetical protein